MAIRFAIDGIHYEADSPEEAVQLRELLQPRENPPPPKTRLPPTVLKANPPAHNGSQNGLGLDTEPSHRGFIRALNANGLRIVHALIDSPDGISTDELAARTEIASLALPPVMRHVRTAAEKAGFDYTEFIHRDQVMVDRQPKSRYTLPPGLRARLFEIMEEK